MMSGRAAVLLCLAIGHTATPALAAGGGYGDFRDPSSGLEVAVPPDFVWTPAQPPNGVMLKRGGDDAVVCEVRFEASPAEAPEATASPGKRAAAIWLASPAARTHRLVSAAPRRRQHGEGPKAVAILADRRQDLPAFPRQKRRSLTIMWETAKGRTQLVCEAPKVRFGILRRDFDRLANGVTPPR